MIIYMKLIENLHIIARKYCIENIGNIESIKRKYIDIEKEIAFFYNSENLIKMRNGEEISGFEEFNKYLNEQNYYISSSSYG